ncbi:MAG: ABC transporter permease [Endomicrobium sp.]|jgi:ABC-2 type transport system permease protein|nr:ABC transporter permease [Endomicrobium sp.]
MPRISIIKAFLKKEIAQTLRDKKMIAVIFFAPIIQMVLFGFALTNEVKNISIHCAYSPQDVLAQKIEKRILESGWFVNAESARESDYSKILSERKAEAVLVIGPRGLLKGIEKDSAEIQLLIDAVNPQRAVQIENYVKNIVSQTVEQEFQGAGPAGAMPAGLNVKILYNPTLKSSFFMIPALLGFILCIFTVMLTGISLSKEKENGTFEKLISSPVTVWEILLGKTLTFSLLGFIVALLMVFGAYVLFGITIKGGILKLLLLFSVFIVSSCAVAIFISILAKTQQQSMMGSLLFLFPALLLSGLVFPVENIPGYAGWIAYVNPLYYLLTALRNIVLKGGDWTVIAQNCIPLVLIGITLLFFGVKKFKSKL